MTGYLSGYDQHEQVWYPGTPENTYTLPQRTTLENIVPAEAHAMHPTLSRYGHIPICRSYAFLGARKTLASPVIPVKATQLQAGAPLPEIALITCRLFDQNKNRTKLGEEPLGWGTDVLIHVQQREHSRSRYFNIPFYRSWASS